MDNWNKKGNEERITAPIVVCILAFGLCWVKYLGLFLSSIALFMIVDARRDKATAKSSNYKVSLIISIIALVISFFVTVLRPLSNEGKAEEVISSSSYEFGEFDDISSSEKESEGKANELTRNKLDVDDSQSPIIESTIIYEGHDVVITANEIKKNGSGWDIYLLIENNSSLNLDFNAHAYAINGIMTRNSIYSMDCSVAAEKKANVVLKLEGEVIKKYGISSIRCVDVLFWAYNSDTSFKAFDTGQIEIKTNLYDGTHDSIHGSQLFDSKGIKVDYLGREGTTFSFVITNETGLLFSFDFDELSVNDYTTSKPNFDLFNVTVLKDCQVVVTVNVDYDFLSLNGITEIKSIEWNMAIRPDDDFFKESKVGPIIYSLE